MKAKKTLGMGMQELLQLTLRDEMSEAEKLLADKKRQIARLELESQRLKPAKTRKPAAAEPAAESPRCRELEAEVERLRRRLAELETEAREKLPDGEATELYQQALAALKAGRSAEAMRGLSVLLHFRPDHLKAWNNLGVAFYELGLLADAGDAFRRVLALDSGHAAARENLLAIEAAEAGRGDD